VILKLHDGREVDIGHLAPRMVACPCEPIGRDLTIRVVYKNHCYSEAFCEARHAKEEILFYDSPESPRVFCPIRHGLSHQLPALIERLPSQKVHQTPEARNYVYVVSLRVSNQIYEIYFMLQRAQPEDEADLRLTIESAYPVETAGALPNRPNKFDF
jgi:hypothetical protein